MTKDNRDRDTDALIHSIPTTKKLLGGSSDSTIYRLIKRKAIEAVKIGDRTFITDKSIRALVDNAPRMVTKRRKGAAKAA